jgi:hypothetical protein
LTLWSAANLLMGAAILSGSHFVASFLTSFYNNYYEELLPMMMSQRKSVLTYASHSLAGFFLYLFFWVNLRSYKATGKSRYLIFAVGHAALCMTLLSHTSFVFSAVASMELIWFFCSKRPLLTAALGLIFLWFAWNAIPRVIGVDDWGKVKTLAVLFWQGDAGGVTARYARTGTQGSALEFIKEGGLPIGAIRSEAISPFVSDSGPIDYFLRGSLPLLLLMYGGLWFFLRRNLINRSDCYRLFFAILAAEVGIEVLPYTRTFCLLPVFMVLLNSLAIRSELPPGRKLRIKF